MQTTSASSPRGADDGFVPVEGGNQQVSETGSVVTAYLAMWAVLMVFVLLGWRKLAAIQASSARIETALDREKS